MKKLSLGILTAILLVTGSIVSANDGYFGHNFSGLTISAAGTYQLSWFNYKVTTDKLSDSGVFRQSKNDFGGEFKVGYNFVNTQHYLLGISAFANVLSKPQLGNMSYQYVTDQPNSLFVSQVKKSSDYGLMLTPGYLLNARNLIYVNLGVGAARLKFNSYLSDNGVVSHPLSSEHLYTEYVAGLGYEGNVLPNFGVFVEDNISFNGTIHLTQDDPSSSTTTRTEKYSNLFSNLFVVGVALHL